MVGSPDDLLPDRGAVAARQALAAAEERAGVRRPRHGVARGAAAARGGRYGRPAAGDRSTGACWSASGCGSWWAWAVAAARLRGSRWRASPARSRGAGAPAGGSSCSSPSMVAVVVVGIVSRTRSIGDGQRVVRGRAVRCWRAATSSHRSCGGRGRAAGRAGATPWPDGARATPCCRCWRGAQWVHPDRLAGAHRPAPRTGATTGCGPARSRGSRDPGGSRADRDLRNAGDHPGRPGPARRVDVRAHAGRAPALSRGPTRRRRPAPT